MPYNVRTLSATLILSLALPGALAAQESEAPATEDGAQTAAEPAPVEVPEEGAEAVIATVNGTDITLGHMMLVKETLPEQYRQLPDEVLWDGVLQQIIQQVVLADSLEGEPNTRVRLSLENEERGLRAAQAAVDIAGQAVTDEAVQSAYDAQYAGADQGQEYNASHILVETEEEARALIEELEGDADFATLARENSTGPSASNGGQLGWFAKGDMVAPFEEAVADMEAGAVSEPVETQFGWHVIKLNETRVAEAPALEEVRGELEAQLQREAVETRITDLTESAEIDRSGAESLSPALLSRTDLLEE